jgi:hypothetical protein
MVTAMNARLDIDQTQPASTKPPAPPKMPANDETIPAELKRHKRWVLWNWVWSEKAGKYTKPPLQASGQHASTIDPATWASYDNARLFGLTKSGIGFVLGNEVGIVGIDLDDCRDPLTGAIKPLQAEIIKQLDTYAEVSPSGTGVKLLCKAQLPEKCRKADHEIGLEIYGDKRYFTITGCLLPGCPTEINSRQVVVDELITRWMTVDREEMPRPIINSQEDEIELAKSALLAISVSRADGYWDWLTIGMALHAISPTLLEEWDRWSATSSKYEAGMCERKWSGFGHDGFGPGTLYHFAKLDGWRPAKGWRKSKVSKGVDYVPEETGDKRTQVEVSDNELQMVNDVITALGAEPNLFVRNDKLIEVFDAPNPADPQNTTTIAMRSVPEQKLRTMISGRCCFTREDGEGGSELKIAKIPGHIASQIFHHATYPGIRPIIGVSEWPFMRPDGSICSTAGYDAATKTILKSSVEIAPIKDEPTIEDAWSAMDSLLGIVEDFEFESVKHKAAWLAAVLTIGARPAINGPVPLFLIDASIWGSGKSKLATLVALIYSGRTMPITAWPSKDEEVSKSLATFIVEGRPWVLWDNAKTLIAGQSLEAVLTSQNYINRKLGKTESCGELPVYLTQFISGNNAVVSDDIARRTCHIRLVSTSESPDSRSDFKIPNLEEHVVLHRARYIHNALTILRGWQVAKSKEATKNAAWGSFESWSRTVRDALVWLGLDDVRETSTDLKLDTTGHDSYGELLDALVAAGIPAEGWTSREIVEAGTQQDFDGITRTFYFKNKLLHSVLNELVGSKREINTREVGKALKRYHGRILHGKKLNTNYDKANKVNKWVITGAESISKKKEF